MPAALIERAVRELVRQQLAVEGRPAAGEAAEAATGGGAVQEAVELRVREAVGPLSEELRARLKAIEAQRPPEDVGALVQEALGPLSEELGSKASEEARSLVREALQPFREELGTKVSEDTVRRLAEAATEEAIQSLRRELSASTGAAEAAATAKAEELVAPLREAVQGKASADDAKAVAKREAADAAAELRKEVPALIEDALRPLSEDVKTKLGAEEAQEKVEQFMQQQFDTARQAAVAELRRRMSEEAAKLREEMRQKADAEGTQQALAQLREGLEALQQRPPEAPEAALRQVAAASAAEALAPLGEELRGDLRQLREAQAALERLAEELQQKLTESAAARPDVAAKVREELQQQLSAGAIREQVEACLRETSQPSGASQEALDALQAEVAELRQELRTLREQGLGEAALETRPRHPAVRAARTFVQLLVGGAVLLIGVGLVSEPQKRTASTA